MGHHVSDNLCRLSQQMQAGFNLLSQHQEKTIQLMLAIKRDDVPRLLLLLPEDFAKKPTPTNSFKTVLHEWTKKTNLRAYYRLIVFDEGPMLVHGTRELVPVGEGITVSVPGETLQKIAPFIAFVARLAAVMTPILKLAGIIPLLGDSAHLIDIATCYEGIASGDSQSDQIMGAFMDAVKTIDTLDKVAASAGELDQH